MSTPTVQDDDRLESWKEIAGFLKRDIRTVQRWEKTAGLPVHRFQRSRSGAVYAYRSQLESWVAARTRGPDSDLAILTPSASNARIGKRIASAIVLTLLAGIAIWIARAYRTTSSESLHAETILSLPDLVQHLTFSPDGTQVAYSWTGDSRNAAGIYITKISGSPPSSIVTIGDPGVGDKFLTSPAWSPDGRWIAYVRFEKNATAMIVPASGGIPRELTQIGETKDMMGTRPYLAWSRDSRKLVLPCKEGKTPALSLCAFTLHTGEKQRITNAPDQIMADSNPSLSLDGRELAFLRTYTINGGGNDLFTVEVNDDLVPRGEAQRVVAEPGIINDYSWLTNGREFIFGFRESLWRTPARGGVPKKVPFVGSNPKDIAVYQNRLIYVTTSGGAPTVQRLDLNKRQSSPDSDSLISSPNSSQYAQYSPDGKRIAFVSGRQVWVSDAEGQRAFQLTKAEGFPHHPAWSADGAWLAFELRRDRHSQIYVVRSSGGEARVIAESKFNDMAPSWSIDGASVYFASDRTGDLQVWHSPIDGSPPKQITHTGGFNPVESWDGQWIYFVKDKPRGIWRLPVSGGREALVIEDSGIVAEQRASADLCLTKRGLYFWELTPLSANHTTLQFFDFQAKRNKTITDVEGRIAPGLSVSPDDRWLLVSKFDRIAGEIKVVEDFR